MATIKSYTDINQSKKLAKILPRESADMRFCFNHTLDGRISGHYPMIGREPSMGTIPCWSLTALLDVLPKGIIMNKDSQNGRYHVSSIGIYVTADNPIDACYEMILKLDDLTLL